MLTGIGTRPTLAAMTVTAEQLESPTLALDVEKCQELLAQEAEERQRFRDAVQPHEKAEFINGRIIMHSPARARHTEVRGLIERILGAYVDSIEFGLIASEKALCGFTRNDYEPDIVWFGDEKASTIGPDTVVFPVPDLAVEVLSPGTTHTDRGVKFIDYAAHGVQEYWIVDPDSQVVEQYRLEGESYALATKLKRGDFKPLCLSSLVIPHAALFDRKANLDFLRQLLAG
jgi:Uma2 family endonuclease